MLFFLAALSQPFSFTQQEDAQSGELGVFSERECPISPLQQLTEA
jgi:hypothetical protein